MFFEQQGVREDRELEGGWTMTIVCVKWVPLKKSSGTNPPKYIIKAHQIKRAVKLVFLFSPAEVIFSPSVIHYDLEVPMTLLLLSQHPKQQPAALECKQRTACSVPSS